MAKYSRLGMSDVQQSERQRSRYDQVPKSRYDYLHKPSPASGSLRRLVSHGVALLPRESYTPAEKQLAKSECVAAVQYHRAGITQHRKRAGFQRQDFSGEGDTESRRATNNNAVVKETCTFFAKRI